jgi:hypothetical protein
VLFQHEQARESHPQNHFLSRTARDVRGSFDEARWFQTQIGKVALNSYRNGCRFTPARAFVKTSVGDAATIR